MARQSRGKTFVLMGVLLIAGCQYARDAEESPQAGNTSVVREGRIPAEVLAAAELPGESAVHGSHGIVEYTTEFTKVTGEQRFRTSVGELTLCSHPMRYSEGWSADRVRMPRVHFSGCAVLYGRGPLTVWCGRDLWSFSSVDTSWALVDAGTEGGIWYFVMYDNFGAGGPIEVHMERRRMSDLQSADGLEWLDSEVKGDHFWLSPSPAHPDRFEARSVDAQGKITPVGELLVDEDGDIVLKEAASANP